MDPCQKVLLFPAPLTSKDLEEQAVAITRAIGFRLKMYDTRISLDEITLFLEVCLVMENFCCP